MTEEVHPGYIQKTGCSYVARKDQDFARGNETWEPSTLTKGSVCPNFQG